MCFATLHLGKGILPKLLVGPSCSNQWNDQKCYHVGWPKVSKTFSMSSVQLLMYLYYPLEKLNFKL